MALSGTQNAHIKAGQVLESFKDLRIWLVCLATMLSSIPNGGMCVLLELSYV